MVEYKKKKGFSSAGVIISTYRFALCTRSNRYVSVAFPPKYMALGIRLFISMFPHVLDGCEHGGLGEEVIRNPRVQGFVVNVGGGLEVVSVLAIFKKAKKG